MGDRSTDRSAELAYLPAASPPSNHGHTAAAWVLVTLVVVGALVTTIGFLVAEAWLAWTGGGVIVLGVIAGRVLKMLGFGQPGQPDAARRSGGGQGSANV